MSDDPAAKMDRAFHKEGDQLIFNLPKSLQEETAEKERSDDQLFKADQVRTNRKLTLLNTGLLVVGLIGSGVGIWQASIASRAANAARDAANTADKTLNEMRSGSGARDTHALAEAAKSQGTSMERLVTNANKQSSASQTLASTAMAEVKTASQNEKLIEAQTLAHIDLIEIRLDHPLRAGESVDVANQFMNTGSSRATNVGMIMRAAFIGIDRSDGMTLPGEAVQTGDVAAKGLLYNPLHFPVASEALLQQLRMGNVRAVVQGEVTYRDIQKVLHHTYFCVELTTPDGVGMHGCEKQRESD